MRLGRFLLGGLLALVPVVASAQAIPELPLNPNLGYSAVTCPPAPLRFMEANIWVGINKTDPENKRFLQECLPCKVQGGCQASSVSQTLDPRYTWRRINAGCFPPFTVDEAISVTRLFPRIIIVENGGGCNELE